MGASCAEGAVGSKGYERAQEEVEHRHLLGKYKSVRHTNMIPLGANVATKENVPKVQELIAPTVAALRAMGGSGTLQEINDAVADILKLPEDVQLVAKGASSDTWYGYRCRWARSYLKLDSLAENSERGIWSLTKEGLKAPKARIDGVWSRVHALVAARRKAAEPEPLDDELDEVEEARVEAPEDRKWHDLLLDTLKAMKPDAFERLCQRLLRESGFFEG